MALAHNSQTLTCKHRDQPLFSTLHAIFLRQVWRMNGKRIAGATVFVIGGSLGGSTNTNMWDGYSFWVWLLVLFVSITICGVGVELWRSAGKKGFRMNMWTK